MSTNYIDQITDTAGTTHDISEGDSTRIFRATCTTAASTTAKVATLDTSNRNFSLTTGVRVAVTFKYGNSATTPTLRVDGSSTGTAKTIAFPTAVATRTTGNGTTYNTWGPYETVIFTYDGTYWVNTGSALGIYNAYNQAAAAGSGTVTSVGITNGGGLSISGSPITTSGSITVGHSNSVTAQTTQAVYPIKIDAQGHISAYGSAVTIPTDTNTTYALSGALSSHKFTSTLTAGGSGSGTSTSDFTLAAGTGITITDDTSNRKMTIACSVTNTDEKLKTDRISTEFSYFPVLTKDTTSAGTKFYDSNFEYMSNDGTSTTPYIAGQSILCLGNSITSGVENRAGWLQLYGSNSYNIILSSGSPTGNRTVILPDGNGTLALTSDIPDVSGFITSDSDEKVKVAAGSSSTSYYPVLATGAGTATRQYLSTVQLLNSSSYGTELILGKSDGTSQGLIQLWSKTSGYYTSISPENTLTANRGIKLPDKDGTIALTSDIPSITFTQTLTEGTEIGKININGTNTSIYSKDPIWVTKISNTSITATSANTWFYTNQSITVPAGHIYLVQVYVNYSNTKCLGLGMHTASTFSQYYNSPFYHAVSASSTDHLGVAAFMLHGGTTWYCWLKYAGANSNTVYIRYLDFPFST